MSEVTAQNQGISPIQLPPSVSRLLAAVRSRLKRYSVMSGLLLILSVSVGVFWITSGIDSGWFALQRLELPVGIRSIVLVGILCAGIWLLVQRVLRPLFRPTRDTELALVLERKFPAFQDRLMTTVEGTSGYPDGGSLVDGMLQRTVDQTADIAQSVTVDEVFDLQPLRKSGWIAGLLALSVAGSAFARPGSLERWWSAFVLCEESYHLRTTKIEATVIAQPGDRRMNFRDANGQMLYLHPRGADLELEFLVPEGSSETGEPWVVPERVRVDVIRADGSRSRAYVSSTTDRRFRFILTRLQESVEIEVLAGDYRTPQPWRVEAVTPPAIDTMSVHCRYPDYTDWNDTAETVVPVLGSEVSLPMGTAFELTADSNKPLQSVRIVTDFFELLGDRSSAHLKPQDGYQGHLVSAAPLVSADGRLISARFRLVLSGESSEAEAEVEVKAEAQSAVSDNSHLPIPSNTSLRFFLHDEDDVISGTPESLRIHGIADKPPVVAVRTVGVSNSVTRHAKIPFAGVIQDDYGLVKAGFEFLVDDRTDWSPRSFENRFSPGQDYDLEAEGGVGSEYFSVQRGDLTEGQTLAVSIVAVDNCDIPEAHRTRSEPVVFRIVSNEELLSLLYTREMSLRRRFEEVVQQLEDVRTDLQFHIDVAKRLESGTPASENHSEDRIAVTTCATRAGNNLRRQNNELESIVDSFDEIIQELINNAIPPKQLAENMRRDIVTPLRKVTTGLMVTADHSVSRFRVSAGSGEATSDLIEKASEDVSVVISELRLILESVRDMAELHEVLSDLKNILEEQQRINEETKREQIRRLGF